MLYSFLGVTALTVLLMQYNPDAIFLYVFIAGPLLGIWIAEVTNWGKAFTDWFKLNKLILSKQIPFRYRKLKKAYTSNLK